MNERDSEQVAAQLVAKGYTLAESDATADVILLNTCSVRDMANRKRSQNGRLAADVAAIARMSSRIHGLHGPKPRRN
jgi:tRNA A37 methylthiotransferase MiaB